MLREYRASLYVEMRPCLCFSSLPRCLHVTQRSHRLNPANQVSRGAKTARQPGEKVERPKQQGRQSVDTVWMV